MTFFYRQMPRLVAEGHLYVAQPPLYMLTQKKERRYVQTEPEMQAILIEVGLADARLEPAGAAEPGARRSRGDRLKALLEVVTGLDNALRAFGRRNLPLRPFLAPGPPGDRPAAALPRPGVRRHGRRLALHRRGAGVVPAGPRRARRADGDGDEPTATAEAAGESPSSTRSGRSTSGWPGSATSSA